MPGDAARTILARRRQISFRQWDLNEAEGGEHIVWIQFRGTFARTTRIGVASHECIEVAEEVVEAVAARVELHSVLGVHHRGVPHAEPYFNAGQTVEPHSVARFANDGRAIPVVCATCVVLDDLVVEPERVGPPGEISGRSLVRRSAAALAESSNAGVVG